jgi:hypothetical protein
MIQAEVHAILNQRSFPTVISRAKAIPGEGSAIFFQRLKG